MSYRRRWHGHSLRKNDSRISNVMNIKTTLKMPNMKTKMKMETIRNGVTEMIRVM